MSLQKGFLLLQIQKVKISSKKKLESRINEHFNDKYFQGIDFDLSKAIFIFSFNDEYKINKILKDRMYNIETKGYNTNDKIEIAKHYLIPTIEKQINIDKESVVIDEECFKYIVEKYPGIEF